MKGRVILTSWHGFPNPCFQTRHSLNKLCREICDTHEMRLFLDDVRSVFCADSLVYTL